MARVYLFNAVISAFYGPSIAVTVNGATPTYKVPSTYESINYVPFSTSGLRAPGDLPDGNKFVNVNRLLVESDAPARYGFDLPAYNGDLIAYFFHRTIMLFGQDGLYLRSYDPAITPAGAASANSAAVALRDGAGSVYMFNLFSEPVTVSSNGGTIGEIPAWSAGGGSAPPIYTPANILANRVLNPSDGKGKIANGNNTITVLGESVGSFNLPIDGARFPLNQNLLAYLMRDYWFLSDQFSNRIESGPIPSAQAYNFDSCDNP
jgi:hypothetical protein